MADAVVEVLVFITVIFVTTFAWTVARIRRQNGVVSSWSRGGRWARMGVGGVGVGATLSHKNDAVFASRLYVNHAAVGNVIFSTSVEIAGTR
jgi:hypothetical protein